MAITRVGTDTTAATTNDVTKTSLALTSATPSVGNLVTIVGVLTSPGTSTTNDFATPSGWTLQGTALDAGTPSVRGSVFTRVWQAGDTLPTLTWSIAANAVAAVSVRAGVDTTTPVHQVSVAVHGGTTTARTTNTITTTAATVVEYGFGDRNGSTYTKGTGTDDTLATITLASSAGASAFAIPGVSSAGAYTRTATATVTTSIGVSWIYALLPAASASPDPGAFFAVL